MNDVMVNVPEGFSAPLFTWDNKRSSSKLTLDNENLTCTVKEGSGFKTTLGTEVFQAGGRYYFELFINKGQLIKIGVCRLDINLEEAFSDTLKGWGIYNGELRHNSNSTGPKYGTQLSSNDIIGVALDMVEGTLAFYRNNEYWGIAYKDEELKHGELVAACAPIYVGDQFTLRSMVKED